ncbi:LysM peptidoglycan-binding domain-containing protein [Paenibacillus woosongensis]|uniref:LysM peptidoglycan-binding domain-containing protein n=1 Tax=Paenibacillus woosongensis TaxID=307580 RepID=A0AA95I5V4_9BACL|nr:LysM peptidoglycan-binding domain-containing protein [Paenibacillus woosongensis]WHX47878.1 LysM peptidoglycan-binding domain-containing protein [Paenibacillus woosongensis]
MEIRLIDEAAGTDFVFPVNPEEVRITRGKGYETLNMLSYGEFDMATAERVREITFSSFFPARWGDHEMQPAPKEAMHLLTEMMNSKRPVRLIIENLVNLLVFITVHDTTFKGGEPDDIYFDLTARMWRQPKVHTKAGSAAGSGNSGGGSNRPDLKKTPKAYTVKSGDSLSKIAKLELGDSSKWSAIYNLNKKMIGPNPNLIKPGQKLVMPS